LANSNVTFAELGGVVRLRACLAPYDPKNMSLDERVVTFDSGRRNVMRLLTNGVAAAGALPTKAINYPSTFGGIAGTRTVRRLSLAGANGPTRPTLAWMRDGGGTLTRYLAGTPVSGSGISTSYVRGYGTCAVTLEDDEICFSPSRAGMEYAYFVFGTNPTSAETSGGNGGRLGLHPLYGMGAFISRPGFDHLTCGLDDMMLSTRNNHFQIEETGTVTCNLYGGGGANWSSDRVDGDPFPLTYGPASARRYAIATLSKAYPHYPPVIAYSADGGNQELVSIFWLSSTQILLAGMPSDPTPIRYAVVGSDPAYVPGTDSSSVCRVHMEPGGLFITKKDVSFYSAGANDFLFRSDRLTPYFPDFGSITTAQNTNWYSLPAAGVPPVGAGTPFGFILVADGTSGWWCGCGKAQSQDIVDTVGGQYQNIFRATITSRTQYLWEKASGWTAAPFGWVAAMNISDF
jgi:hypothetical protein